MLITILCCASLALKFSFRFNTIWNYNIAHHNNNMCCKSNMANIPSCPNITIHTIRRVVHYFEVANCNIMTSSFASPPYEHYQYVLIRGSMEVKQCVYSSDPFRSEASCVSLGGLIAVMVNFPPPSWWWWINIRTNNSVTFVVSIYPLFVLTDR